MTNLSLGLLETAEAYGDRPALRQGDLLLTYSEFDDVTARAAAMLRARGVSPGDRVGIMIPNRVAFPIIYYGIIRVGAVVVPMNPLLKSREVAFYLSDSGAKMIFAFEDFAEEASKGAADASAECVVVTPNWLQATLGEIPPDPEIAERAGTDTVLILYTSGTTGKPKGAELTHANMGMNAAVSVPLFTIGPDDVIFGGLPLFHSFGQTCGLNAAVRAGACLTLLPRFDARAALEVLQRDRVTIMQGVPTMYVALLQFPGREDYDTSALRRCVSGGAALPLEVFRGFEEAFETIMLEGYGLSETSPVASFNHPDRERKAGSIGTPIEGVEFRLVDDDWNDVAETEVGEIAIRGHNVMKGYWNRPEATAEVFREGWFRTGDMARRDEDGYYFVVDRKKDLIIRGGFNVYPREVEEVLYEHPAVSEAAVIGLPHPTHGEEVGAAVVLLPGASATPDELRRYVKERLAAYKYPRQVWLVDSLPKGPTGKILKREITPPADVVGG
ncbi:MAG TPA: long-chain fatty acid--CoA ligase [Actinoplanes sp.]|nr:long-chain fatty acid--CoA ligase [Actinoplanes sp.]